MAAESRTPWIGEDARLLVARIAIAVTGASLVVLAARSGSPGWIAARLVAIAAATAGAAALANRSPGLAAPALLFAGIVGTAAGAGFAPPWLAKQGFSVPAAAGIAALAGGLALLILGLARAVSTLTGWRRWPGLAGLLIGTGIVVFSLAIAVASTNVPPTDLGARTPADLGSEYEEASFETADGVLLSGWYLPADGDAAVVLAHGAGSTRTAVLDHAAVLNRNGYGVLLYDARGHGRSGGRAMDFGWHGDADLAAAVGYVASLPGVDPGRIGIVGLSMGGEQAIGAAASDRRVSAVVAEGATGRTAADKRWLSAEFGFQGWVQERIDDLTFWFADLLTSASPPISLHDAAAAAAPHPVLLIVAGEVPDEGRAARFIRSASPETVTIWEVEGAGHTGGLATEPDGWEERVTSFLDAALD